MNVNTGPGGGGCAEWCLGIGMLVSGALLGARKKNERVLRSAIQRRQGARFRWDPERGTFVF